MYVDFNFYQQTYKGKVPEGDFTRLEIQASSLIDYYTFNRITEVDNKVKFTVCELIDNLQELENLEGKGIDSEKVGSYAVTYSKVQEKELKQEQKNIIVKYLGHTGLMYRGF